MEDNWGSKLKKKRMTSYAKNAASANVIPLVDGPNSSWQKHFASADMVSQHWVSHFAFVMSAHFFCVEC